VLELLLPSTVDWEEREEGKEEDARARQGRGAGGGHTAGGLALAARDLSMCVFVC